MDDNINNLDGLSDEEKLKKVNNYYDKLKKQLPNSFPELYGMTDDEVENEGIRLEEERDKKLIELGFEYDSKSSKYKKSLTIPHQNHDNNISVPIAPAFKDKLQHLKEFKVKNPPNPKPGPKRDPGQSAHPSKNRRSRENRKRARLNQTKIVLSLYSYLIIENSVTRCCINRFCIWCS